MGSLSKGIVWRFMRPDVSSILVLKKDLHANIIGNDLVRLNSMAVLEDGEDSVAKPPRAVARKRGLTPRIQKQMERIQRLPKAQQRVVMKMIDAVLAQLGR